MKKRNSINGAIIVISLIFMTVLLLAACGSDADNNPENELLNELVVDPVDSLTTLTGILIEATLNAITIQMSDGTTYTFGIGDDTIIEGSEFLGNTLSVSFFGHYTYGIIADSVKTIIEVDHAASEGKGSTNDQDAPQPSEPKPEEETIWYMTGTVVDISADTMHLLYEDGKTYRVLFDENTKKDSGIVVGCVARVFRKGSMRDGMLAIEVQFISAAPTPAPAPPPPPPYDPDTDPSGIVEHARSLVGFAFADGGASPENGFDSSGFIYYVLSRNGVSCPRTTHEQTAIGQKITSFADLAPGDLVFFGEGATAQYGGIYVGGGVMIYSSSRAGKVTASDITQQWYIDSFVSGARI